MPIAMRRIWILPAALCVALSGDAAGESRPTLTVRELTIQADLILVGEPVESKAGALPTRYEVVEVLKGTSATPGEQVRIETGQDYSLRVRWWPVLKDKKPPPLVTKALLFLHRPAGDGVKDGYRPVLSGIRAMTKDGHILVPHQLFNPGAQYLIPREGEDWGAMLSQVRSDLPKIARVLELGDIADRAERNKAVFEWIELHKDEFGGGYYGRSKGWASLESQVCNWIMESCIPEDCWRVLEFSETLGIGPDKSHPSFCTPEGRELLMARIFDEKVSKSLRLKALRELGSRRTFWYCHKSAYPETRIVTPAQRNRILALILPLLDSQDASWRREAVRCLMRASWPGDSNLKHMITKHPLPALVGLYRTERDAGVRMHLVEAIRRLADEAFWKELSGNPNGIAVLLAYRGKERGILEFSLDLKYTRAKLSHLPTLRLERLDASGKTVETRSVMPDLRHPKDAFETGWESWMGGVYVTMPASDVEPGLWQVTAEGRVGEGPGFWRSDLIEITIPKPEAAK